MNLLTQHYNCTSAPATQLLPSSYDISTLTAVHHVTVITSLSWWWWPWDDDGLEGVCRLGHKCWAPVLAAAAAVSGPGHSGLRKIWRKTVNRAERARGLIMMGGARARGQGSEKTIHRPWESRVTNYFCRHITVNYFIRRHQHSCDGSELLPRDQQNVALLGQEITTSVPGLNVA